MCGPPLEQRARGPLQVQPPFCIHIGRTQYTHGYKKDDWTLGWIGSPRDSCKDRVLDGPASGEKGSKGRNQQRAPRRPGIFHPEGGTDPSFKLHLYPQLVRAECEDWVLEGPLRPYPEYSRANSYPWSPSPSRRSRPGPGLHKTSPSRGAYPVRIWHTLEPVAWHWNHWPGILVNRDGGRCT